MPVALHREISFELGICQPLAGRGWLYAEGNARGYDRARALFPADALACVQATQPKAWDALICAAVTGQMHVRSALWLPAMTAAANRR